jgi:hypothetical protein
MNGPLVFVNDQHVLVLAIFHDARDPSIWHDRA